MALNNLESTDISLQGSTERLSTGLQINNGSDNPAGLIISQGMQSELEGITQAIQNTQNANNMAKTADGALSEVGNLLLSLRGLAVNAANSAVMDAAAVQADQTQVTSILQSINAIATDTEFDSKKLLDGTAGTLANITDGTDISSMNFIGAFGPGSIENGPITISKVQSATDAIVTLGQSFASAGAIVTTAGTMVVNGYSISTPGTDTVQDLVDKINAASAQTGVTAQISGTGPVNIVLSASNYGSQYGITYFDANKVLDTKTSETASGKDAVFNVSATTSAGLQTVTFTGGMNSTATGLMLTDTSGNSINLTQTGNANITTVPVAIGQITSGSVQFQIGPDAGQSVNFSLPSVFTQNLGVGVVAGQSLANIDLTTTNGANNAMSIIEAATQQVATLRGQIGSFQSNILEAGQSYLQIANENLTASESSITDTNVASEMTTYTQLQILQQSGISVLAQANAEPKSILTLLQNS
jgi:flagellin